MRWLSKARAFVQRGVGLKKGACDQETVGGQDLFIPIWWELINWLVLDGLIDGAGAP